MYSVWIFAIFALEVFRLFPLTTLIRQACSIVPFLCQSKRLGKKDTLGYTHTLHSRVWPGDLDIWCHKNNIKYVERCEVGRIALFSKNGLLSHCRQRNITVGFSSISLRFRREFKLFQPFKVESKLCGWDDRSWYIDQKFIGTNGFVHCQCISTLKLGRRGKAGSTTPGDILKELCQSEGIDAIHMNKGLQMLRDSYEFFSNDLREKK